MVSEIAKLSMTASRRLNPKTTSRLLQAFRPPGFQFSQTYVTETLWSIFDPPKPKADKPNDEGQWSFALVRPGLLELGVTLGILKDDARIPIHGKRIEAWIVRMTEALAGLADEVGLQGPALVAVQLEGFEDIDILAGRTGNIRVDRPNIFLRDARVSLAEDPVGTQLRRMLDSMWLAFGQSEGSPSFGSDTWDRYGEGSEYQLP